jgi:hypothetical protein
MAEVWGKKRRGYVGLIYDGVVNGRASEDIHKERHEIIETNARFRYAEDRNAVIWNSFPPTKDDMILVEDWLHKKGVRPTIHCCAYVHKLTLQTISS